MNPSRLIAFWRRRPRAAALAAGILLALAAAAGLWRRSRREAAETQPTFEVRRGPLTISVLQSGTIRALQQEVISCEVEGQTTLIFLIEEGARVKQGDLLAELDASGLQDRLLERQIQLQNAEAAYVRSRENLAIVKLQTESELAQAELNYRFAKDDLVQYTEGEYKQALRNAESKIILADEERQLAARKLEWSEKLFAENYISQSERDADRLSYRRAALDLELAQAAKKLLEDFTYKRELARRQSDVVQTERHLARVRLRTAADIVQAEADLRAKEAEWRRQQDKEQKLRQQLEKTKIYAPRDGQVVYASSARMSWRGGEEPLAAGQMVRERQELIYLPTADEAMAVVQVHESALDVIRIGLPVVVTVDALQGRLFLGKVARIAPLPDTVSLWMNPDLKVYRTEIEIEGRQPDLRTGMSCMAEIIVARYDDTLFVPLQAVVRVAGQPTVYVRQGRAFVPVPVDIGLDNNRVVHIRAGLQEGQTVLLTPPLSEAMTEDKDRRRSNTVDDKLLKNLLREAQVPGDSARSAAQPAQNQPRPAAPPVGAARADAARRRGGGEGGGAP